MWTEPRDWYHSICTEQISVIQVRRNTKDFVLKAFVLKHTQEMC